MDAMRAKVVIVGAGPAGSSLAIRLAQRDIRVSLVERENFPREKLCGEFISPECFSHFRELGVADEMLDAGGARIGSTVFYSRNGRSITIPSEWFNSSQVALGLSRAEMDDRLLRKAASAGVKVRTASAVNGGEFDDGMVVGLTVRNGGGITSIYGDLFIDATGRARVLSKLVERSRKTSSKNVSAKRPEFVAFKAHLTNVRSDKNSCEIYSFNSGYGGLNFVEGGKANFCSIVRADVVRRHGSDAAALFASLIGQNKRANEVLNSARPLHEWLAVAIDGFGHKDLRPAFNVLNAGDAAAFIDPFTGSGMLMAFESSKLLADSIVQGLPAFDKVARLYAAAHRKAFEDRLRLCRILRHVTYRPAAASLLISLLSASSLSRRLLTRATRSQGENGQRAT
jgi:flavin-dependent dehydrogenase